MLIGRERDVAAVRRAIVEYGARLVTLSGPPGVGKTRLAVEAARGLTDSFEHGVCFVDLAPIREARPVAAAMTRALGIWEAGRSSAHAALHNLLRDRQVLVVLDNFEQVVDAAPFLAELLAACPRLAFLVTSRTALRVRWEHELPVPPLELPDLGAASMAFRLAESAAGALFVDRARAVRPDFELSDRSAQAIAQVCIRLDGLPLAIELAAGQVKLRSPQAILDQLDGATSPAATHRSSLSLLGGGARDLPARQRTLREAIEWSYALLRPDEQGVFRRLAVFPGSFSLAAMAAVAGHDDDDPAVLLAALIDHSLVRREGASDREPRFRMLQTLREYAHECLDASGETDATRARLTAYFVALAARAHDGLWGSDQAEWLERLEQDLDGIRAVLDWSVSASGDLDAGLLVMRGTCRFWDTRGYFAEGRARTSALLARADATPGPRGSYLVSEGEAYVSLLAGFLAFAQGDFDAATVHARRGMRLARTIGFTFGVATALFGLASLALIRNDLPEANERLDRALALSHATGDARSLYHTLYWQGESARAAGEYDRAVRLLEESLALTRLAGNPWHVATTLFSLGHVALVRGDAARAGILFAESLTVRRPLRDRMGIALVVEALAWVAASNGRMDRAARLLGAASGLRERIGASVELGWTSDHRRVLEQVRAALDVEAFSALWNEGRTLAPGRVIELSMLADPEPAPAPGRPDDLTASGSDGTAVLSPRERETVRLIARGLNNRQIAVELVISRGAAANYVQRVYAKLGFRARAQVAVWAAEHGLGPRQPDGAPG